jgi:hypothetical protein
MFASTAHHIPIMNGLSSYGPPDYGRLDHLYYNSQLDDEFQRIIEKAGAHYVLVHADLLNEKRDFVLQWLQTELNRGRLAFVRRFDKGPEGDFVFAITRNARDWERLRGQQTPDAAGHIPDENLARLLSRQSMYSAATVYWIDHPPAGAVLNGAFQISGWTLSPHGIREVKACFDEGRKCFPARLVERGDVVRRRPWYPKVQRPGFMIDLPKRPKRVRRNTDFYLEIVDGAGRVTRTSDMVIHWN